MAFLEGAPFKCYRHNYETKSVNEWNIHCGDGDHFEEGIAVCQLCGTSFTFSNLPYHRIQNDGSKGISLRCENCEQRVMGKVKKGGPIKSK